jgi:PAP2 superfamily
MKMSKTNLRYAFLLSTLLALFTACEKKNPNFQQDAAQSQYLHNSMQALTQVIKHDLFPPMIAARIYAYSHIAAYEALNPHGAPPQYKSLAGQVGGLPQMPQPEAGQIYCFPVAAVKAYLKVGKKLIFSEDSIAIFEEQIFSEFKKIGIPKDVFERSIAFGDTIGGTVIKWASKDNYAQMRSMPKYTVTVENAARWRPTAPDYADGLEPHWNKIRTLTLDSAAQFKPERPFAFDSTKGSKFYAEAYETYKFVMDSLPENVATGWYWDDNPVGTFNAGHVNLVRKKIPPTGHWLWITMYAAQQRKLDIFATNEAYLRVAIGLFDVFVSCWDEKYRSDVIRPESYITKYIDPNWVPIIVTPPFPEYTSGHSCASGAASVILGDIFGETMSFTDSTEVQFGLEARTFPSFSAAARQASLSRLYAGIHYRRACEQGLKQGEAVGRHVLSRVKTR